MRFTYSKAERLTSPLVRRVLQAPTRLYFSPFKIGFLLVGDYVAGESPVRMSVLIGKRLFKLASHRNRLRRVIVESYRSSKADLYECMMRTKEPKHLYLTINLVASRYANRQELENLVRRRLPLSLRALIKRIV